MALELTSDMAASAGTPSSDGDASNTRRLRQVVWTADRQSTVRLPDPLKWSKHTSARRAEAIALILLRMSLGQRSFEWHRIPRKQIPWAEWRNAGYPAERYVLGYTREPPLPSWERVHKNQCPLCGQQTFAAGAWWPEAGKPRWNKMWHLPCNDAYYTWRYAQNLAYSLAIQQGGVCPITGEAILRERERRVFRDGVHKIERYQVLVGDVQVDHRVPLWRVWREAHRHKWPEVLKFWGVTNLQALSFEGHKRKTAGEARERSKSNGGELCSLPTLFPV